MKNPHYIENKMNIDEVKQNIIRELAKVTNIDIKDTELLKR